MQEVTNAMTVPITRYGNQVLVGFSSRDYEEAFKDY